MILDNVFVTHTETLSEAGIVASDPTKRPVGLLLDELKLEDRAEELVPGRRNLVKDLGKDVNEVMFVCNS